MAAVQTTIHVKPAAPANPLEQPVTEPSARCPNDGTELDWVMDNYHCSDCGDEWGKEVESPSVAGKR